MSQIHVESDLTRYEMIDYLLGMEEYHNNSERDIEDTVGWIWRRIDTTKLLREAIVLGINHFSETENNIETSNKVLIQRWMTNWKKFKLSNWLNRLRIFTVIIQKMQLQIWMLLSWCLKVWQN